ncbi:hypothetical protein Hanom_Chr15g01390171 [Helianthus anomalus]
MHYFKSKFENFQQQALCKLAQSSQIVTIGTLLINTLLIRLYSLVAWPVAVAPGLLSR